MTRKKRLTTIIRELKRQARHVFYLSDRVTTPDEDEIRSAFEFADELLDRIDKESLKQNIPLVVACMQHRMLTGYINEFSKVHEKLSAPTENRREPHPVTVENKKREEEEKLAGGPLEPGEVLVQAPKSDGQEEAETVES